MVTSSFTENSRKTQMTFAAVSGGWGVGGGGVTWKEIGCGLRAKFTPSMGGGRDL